ncbi:MAG: hypothetical protein LC808_13165 [Actinobacteria bacterium]|nr:hypothetical protein [Actinomycetota bacterium]
MTGEDTVKVEKLIELLEEFDPESEVRLASKGFRSRLEDYAIADVDVLDKDGDLENPSVIYIIEGEKVL